MEVKVHYHYCHYDEDSGNLRHESDGKRLCRCHHQHDEGVFVISTMLKVCVFVIMVMKLPFVVRTMKTLSKLCNGHY